MIRIFLSFVSLCLLLGCARVSEEKIAQHYDYVGVVTHSAVPKWNKHGNYRLSEVDPAKVPGGRLLAGLNTDGESGHGDIFVGNSKLFFRVIRIERNDLFVAFDDENEHRILLTRRGKVQRRN